MKCNASVVAGILFAVLGAVLCGLIPSQIAVLEIYSDELSPRFFPYACAGLVIFFGVINAIVGAHERREEGAEGKRQGLKLVGTILLTILVGFAIMQLLGMVVALSLLVAALCYLLGERNWKLLLTIGVVWGVAVYVVFELLFSFALPKGVF